MTNLASELLRTAFLAKIPLLTKATLDDVDPTPELTYDGESVCRDIILWLNGRLTLNSATVKLKTLKLLKHLVDKGHSNFKKILRTQSNEISEACKFGGIMKSLEESLKCSQVRKEANELLEFLYSFQDDEENEKTRPPGVMIGMGSSSFKNMVGFGNSVKSKDSLPETIIKSISGIAEKISDLNFSSKVNFYEINNTQLMNLDANCDVPSRSCYATDITINSTSRNDDDFDLEQSLIGQFVQDSKKSIFKATQSFTKMCQQVDLLKLLKLLDEGLLRSDNKELIKYLIMIEVLQRDALVHPEDLHENFHKTLHNLSMNDSDRSIQLKSRKILLTLKYFLPNYNKVVDTSSEKEQRITLF